MFFLWNFTRNSNKNCITILSNLINTLTGTPSPVIATPAIYRYFEIQSTVNFISNFPYLYFFPPSFSFCLYPQEKKIPFSILDKNKTRKKKIVFQVKERQEGKERGREKNDPRNFLLQTMNIVNDNTGRTIYEFDKVTYATMSRRIILSQLILHRYTDTHTRIHTYKIIFSANFHYKERTNTKNHVNMSEMI